MERFVKYNTFLTFSSEDGLQYEALNAVGRKLAVGKDGFRIDNPGPPQGEELMRHSVNVVNMVQSTEPEPYHKITKLLKQRKTQSQTPPEIAIEPKQLGLVCKEVNSLLASSPTTSVPILGNYECKMSEVLPRKVYNKWALKAFTLSSLIRKASKSVAAWTWNNKIPLNSISVLPETWGLIIRSHQKHFHSNGLG